MTRRIGIDLGGTKIEGVVLSEAGDVLERKRRPTPKADGYDAILDAVSDLIETLELGTHSEGEEPAPIGIGTPGSLSPIDGLMRNSNTTCLNGRTFYEDLKARLGRPFAIANDANCFALAEATLGAGQGEVVVFGVILGTGVGGGIVLNQKIHVGRLGIAGEWGHQTLLRDGHLCFCGRRGCVETCLSGPALERAFTEHTGRSLPLPEIVAEFDHGVPDPRAIAWREEFLDLYGMALANLVNVLDPDIVVLGGGVSNVGWLYDEGLERVHRNIFSDLKETPIVRHTLGDSAGVFGAAQLGASLT